MSSKLPNEAGYDGFSMSLRAREAYEKGRMPKTKWTKRCIIKQIMSKSDKETADKFRKYTKDVLMFVLLEGNEFHHTSYKMNLTEFLHVIDINKNNIDNLLSKCDERKKMYSKN